MQQEAVSEELSLGLSGGVNSEELERENLLLVLWVRWSELLGSGPWEVGLEAVFLTKTRKRTETKSERSTIPQRVTSSHRKPSRMSGKETKRRLYFQPPNLNV